MNGISFTDAFAAGFGVVEPSERQRAIGRAFASAIPQPSLENGGMLQAARFWAAFVAPVFPLSSTVADASQPHAGKTPHALLGTGWSAETVGSDVDAVVVERWREAPLANVGIVTRASGILILDVDPRHDGWRAMTELARECGLDLASVPRSESPRQDGGAHLWFRVPEGQDYPHSPIVRGVDRPWQVPVPPSMRYVVADPESKDPDRRMAFRPYVWVAGDPRALPQAPERLLSEGISQAVSTGQAGASSGVVDDVAPGTASSVTPGGVGARIGATVVDAIADAGGVPVGQQSYVFKRMACSMVRRNVPPSEIVRKLADAAAASPVGDPAHAWTAADFESMVRHAERFIAQQTAREAVENGLIASITTTTWGIS